MEARPVSLRKEEGPSATVTREDRRDVRVGGFEGLWQEVDSIPV